MSECVHVYLVERTFSDDELNLLILTYATADGEYTHRRERAIPLVGSSEINIPQRRTVHRSNLSPVTDSADKDWYRQRVSEAHDRDSLL